MKIFCTREVLSSGKIVEYEGTPSTETKDCFEVHHEAGGISYFYLLEDAFLTREEALVVGSAQLTTKIQELVKEKLELESTLSGALKFLQELA
jgi:hypothetical protein